MKCVGKFKIPWLWLCAPLLVFLLGMAAGYFLCWFSPQVEPKECPAPVVNCPEPQISLECPKQEPPVINLTCPDPVVNVDCKMKQPQCW